MGEVPIITKLGEDGLIQPQCADHPSRRQFKHLPHRLHQYIVPVLTTAMGIDIHGDWISFADGIGGWLLGPPPQMIVPQMDIKYNNP